MADLLNLTMLICACIGAMAFGILSAYGILHIGFALMRHQQLAVHRVPVAVKVQAQIS